MPILLAFVGLTVQSYDISGARWASLSELGGIWANLSVFERISGEDTCNSVNYFVPLYHCFAVYLTTEFLHLSLTPAYIRMKARYKYEIALAAGMSPATFRRWLTGHVDRLTKMGVPPTKHLLPPRAVKYVCYELGIHEDDF